MKEALKILASIFGMLILLFTQGTKAQTYYGMAYTSERADGDNGTEYRPILTYVFTVKFCGDKNVSLNEANEYSSVAIETIRSKFDEEYDYSLKRKNHWISNKMFIQVKIFESYNEANSEMKQIVSKYKSKKSDGQGDIGMMDIYLECIK